MSEEMTEEELAELNERVCKGRMLSSPKGQRLVREIQRLRDKTEQLREKNDALEDVVSWWVSLSCMLSNVKEPMRLTPEQRKLLREIVYEGYRKVLHI